VALEQLVEVVFAEEGLALLQSLIEDEAFDHELAQRLRRQMRNCVAW